MSVCVYILNKNYGLFLERAIKSVLFQNHTDIQIIIIDDGSTDNSQDIIDEYSHKYNIQIHINSSSIGLVKNANIARRLCSKKYILRLDADDILLPGAISSLYLAAEGDADVSMVFGNYNIVDHNENIIKRRIRLSIVNEVETLGTTCHGACCLINAQSLNEINGYNETFDRQDGLYVFHSFKSRGYKIINIPNIIFNYTQHDASLSRNKAAIHETRSHILNYIAGEHCTNYQNKFVAVFPLSNLTLVATEYGGTRPLIKQIKAEVEFLRTSMSIEKFVIITDRKDVLNCHKDLDGINIIGVIKETDTTLYDNNLSKKISNILLQLKYPLSSEIIIRNIDFRYTSFFYYRSCMAFKSLYSYYKTVLTVQKLDGTIYQNERDTLKPLFDHSKISFEKHDIFLRAGGISIHRLESLIEGFGNNLDISPMYGIEIVDNSAFHVSQAQPHNISKSSTK